MGRISVDLPDELEKQFILKTVEKFGGKKGDLSRGGDGFFIQQQLKL
ncbi:MAG TPA: hypothetical protein VI864_03910 [Candidatus Bathyarchaeia archaeon]|nr:hypothetical protein [Candidatus Bathyarchaeia archaeon]